MTTLCESIEQMLLNNRAASDKPGVSDGQSERLMEEETQGLARLAAARSRTFADVVVKLRVLADHMRQSVCDAAVPCDAMALILCNSALADLGYLSGNTAPEPAGEEAA